MILLIKSLSVTIIKEQNNNESQNEIPNKLNTIEKVIIENKHN